MKKLTFFYRWKKALIALLTVVHVAVSFSWVYLNSSQVVLLRFGLLPLKGKRKKISPEIQIKE